MITEGEAAIPLETTRRVFCNQEKSNQRSAIDGIQSLSAHFSIHLTRVVTQRKCNISWYLWMLDPRLFQVELQYVDICGTKQFRIESTNGSFSYFSISTFRSGHRESRFCPITSSQMEEEKVWQCWKKVWWFLESKLVASLHTNKCIRGYYYRHITYMWHVAENNLQTNIILYLLYTFI